MREHLPYRARDGLILGVCKGLAQALEIPVWVARALAILGLVFSGGWMILVYVVVGLLMRPEPLGVDAREGAPEDPWATPDDELDLRLLRLEDRLRRLEEQLGVRRDGPSR